MKNLTLKTSKKKVIAKSECDEKFRGLLKHRIKLTNEMINRLDYEAALLAVGVLESNVEALDVRPKDPHGKR